MNGSTKFLDGCLNDDGGLRFGAGCKTSSLCQGPLGKIGWEMQVDVKWSRETILVFFYIRRAGKTVAWYRANRS